MDQLEVFLGIARDLTSAVGAADRYRRLLAAVTQLVPCDAACLLVVDGDALVPLAAHGLAPDVLGRRFVRREHARLDHIASGAGPVLFAVDCALPDPFDGLLDADATALAHVHACLGCPLRIGDELVGVLTADALAPDAFDSLDLRLLHHLGALAAAAMHTGRLVDALEASTAKLGLVAQDLMRASVEQRGADLYGVSPEMDQLRREIGLVAEADVTVLITGETGVGKELVARAIHARSRRKSEVMLYVNCAALPESVAESELFGHVRGAFTGAAQERPGKFEVADGGTLFLDEIGELAPSVQAKLLRALQEGEIQRVGADRPRRVDVRILAATNRNLVAEVEAGRFRADLYHRLDVYPIKVPPLRARPSDIALLAGHFTDRARLRLGVGPIRLTSAAHAALVAHDWPGNVRELKNLLYRAVLRASEGVPRGNPVVVDAPHLGLSPLIAPATPSASVKDAVVPERPPIGLAPLRTLVEDYERRLILGAVEESGGNWARAATALGMHRSNLHALAKRLGLRGA
ncbi:nitric oxide reductase transcriptional regulator NorR [Myxococcota bacterium]|nr:nitric oxide reductase transcriptional regulator NorR [Myxococcota bacterium]